MYVHTYTNTCTHACIRIHPHHVRMHVHIIHTHIRTYTHVYCINIHIYVCTHTTCIYDYAPTHIKQKIRTWPTGYMISRHGSTSVECHHHGMQSLTLLSWQHNTQHALSTCGHNVCIHYQWYCLNKSHPWGHTYIIITLYFTINNVWRPCSGSYAVNNTIYTHLCQFGRYSLIQHVMEKGYFW